MNKFLLCLLIVITLITTGCSKTDISDTDMDTTISPDTEGDSLEVLDGEPGVLTTASGSFEYGLLDSVEDGSILHAWNWSMEDIFNSMQQIASAGYSTIQTSVMQPQKDYLGKQSWSESWWKLYQPLGFSVAKEGENALGSADDLEEVCLEAEKYGIKIIVDVVANHLAGDSSTVLSAEVAQYEPEIYDQNLIHTYGGTSDSSVQAVVQGAIGDYVDLQTESDIVQERVLSLLKEYIDLGVSGFRFDAAKHIETPDDGDYASEFWPTVLGGATSYYQEVNNTNNTPYYYGEILNTVGTGRTFDYYLNNMSITNNSYSTSLLNNIKSGSIASGNLAITSSWFDSSNSVYWSESHDTYANDSQETTNVNQQVIDKAYVIEVALGYTSLYFARPKSNSTIGSIGTNDYLSAQISAINQFDNYFNNSSVSYLASDNQVFIERSLTSEVGLAIVSLNEKVIVSDMETNLVDGSYIDRVSGNEFIVLDGKLSGSGDSTGIVVLQKNTINSSPIIDVDYDSLIFNTTTNVTISCYNADEVTYQIGIGSIVDLSGSVSLSLGENYDYGILRLTVTATNSDGTVVQVINFKKADPNLLDITVYNIDVATIENKIIYAWVWVEGGDGRWVSGELDGSTFTFIKDKEDTHFLLAAFDEGVEPSWNQTTQTTDIAMNGEVTFDFSNITWKVSL